ncbi:hypothetical protein FH5T_10210 [Draconibacterium orientale]|uniref:Uncharacterized protein n=1 Tax=Draconibacterium orientale TaxID=1168034 RepID=A0ABM5QDY2_9BACT|nr:hypothetical protein FH5T_10210 [Draconibacterium orientale]
MLLGYFVLRPTNAISSCKEKSGATKTERDTSSHQRAINIKMLLQLFQPCWQRHDLQNRTSGGHPAGTRFKLAPAG